MINTKFELYKLQRELKRSGKRFEFFRNEKNKFGEPVDEPVSVGRLVGIYHEQNSNVQISGGNTVRTRTEKLPMILCEYSKAKKLGIRPDDFIVINDKKMIVSGIVDVQEWKIVADISFEVVDEGYDFGRLDDDE